MSNLTNLVIAQSFGDLLTTTNGGQGLSTTLQPLQDGFGNNSTVEIATNSINFDRSVGNTFKLDGFSLTAQAIYIDIICQPNPIIPGDEGMVVPSGPTIDRPIIPINGTIRYNTETAEMEYYVNNAWMTVTGTGDVTGPASSVLNGIPLFADTTGKLLKDSGITIGAPPPISIPLGVTVGDTFLIGIDGIDFAATALLEADGEVFANIFKNTPGLSPVSLVISPVVAVPTTDSALLELSSTTGAFVLSRMTTTEMNALDPTNGMVIYNTTQNQVYARQSSAWSPIGSGGSVTSIAAVTTSVGLTITGSPITTSGTFTFILNAELQGLAGLAATGILSRTGAGTYSPRTLTGTASQITITNGDGVSGNPTFALASSITGLTSLTVGNLNLAGNTISSTDSNGNILLTPNGTGEIRLSKNAGVLGANSFRFYRDNNSFFVGFKASNSILASRTYTWPLDFPSVSGQVLSSSTSGIMSWITNGGGGGTVTNIFGTANQIVSTDNLDTTFTISLADNAIFPGTASITVPTGPNSGRPGSPTVGMIRYNTTIDTLETYNNSSWVNILDTSRVVGTTNQIDVFTTGGGVLQIAIDPFYLNIIQTAATDAANSAEEAGIAAVTAEGAATAAEISASSASGSAIASAASAAAAATAAASAAASAIIAAQEAGELSGALNAKYILQEVESALPNAQSLGTLTSGLVKNTVSGPVGVLSTATPAVDYYAPNLPTRLLDTGDAGNFFAGTNSGNITLTGGSNVGVGNRAARDLTTGNQNTMVGQLAGNFLKTGSDNVMLGYLSGSFEDDYEQCIFLGSLSTGVGTTLTNAVAIGFNVSVQANNSVAIGNGGFNVGINTSAPAYTLHLENSTLGTGSTFYIDNTVALPTPPAANAGGVFYTSIDDFFFTSNANTINFITTGQTGDGNMFVGTSVGNQTLSGDGNVIFGKSSGNAFTTAVNNTLVGHQVAPLLTGSDSSVFVGYTSGFACTSSLGLTAIGAAAGSSQTTYTTCTFLGVGADADVNNLTNATAIGANAIVSVDNAVVLGGGSFVGINNSSPAYTLHLDNVGGTPACALFMANTTNVPGTPTGGGFLYVQSGALKYKGSSGTITTLAPA